MVSYSNIVAWSFESIALVILSIYLFAMVHRSSTNDFLRQTSMGLVFGAAAAYSIASPIELSAGYIFDLRNLFIGIAAAYFGWLGGAIALAMGVTVRLMAGGDGAILGVLSMAMCAIAGILWRTYWPEKAKNSVIGLLVLGTMSSLGLAIVLTLLVEMIMPAINQLVGMVAVFTIFGTLIIGKLLNREEKILAQTAILTAAAQTDPLTNLINRRTLMDEVEKLSAANCPKTGYAVIFLDIDHFKSINDRYGHLIGDIVLQKVVRRIREGLRPNDLFSRLGGDEFVIVLPNISDAGARAAAERSRRAVSSMAIEVENKSIPVSVSAGVYWSKTSLAFERLINSADESLYQSKANGGDQVTVHSSTNVDVPNDLEIIQDETKRTATALSLQQPY